MAGPYGFGVFDKGDEAKIEAAKTFIDFVCNDQTVAPRPSRPPASSPSTPTGAMCTRATPTPTLRAPFALMSDYLGRYYNLTGAGPSSAPCGGPCWLRS